MSRTRYIWDKDARRFVDIADLLSAPCAKAPMIMRDIEEYCSPITGEQITSRSQHRQHMRQHDVIEAGNEPPRPPERKPMPSVGEDLKRAWDTLET